MEEEGLIIPSKSVVPNFRNQQHHLPMNTLYQNMYHPAAINASIPMYPQIEVHHQQSQRQEMFSRRLSERDNIEMTTFSVSFSFDTV